MRGGGCWRRLVPRSSRDGCGLVAVVVLVITVAAALGALIRWEYNECRGVGHGVAYCVVQLGRR